MKKTLAKMKCPKHFRLEELLTSSTARQKSIENLPSWEVIERLLQLCEVLDDIRDAWGSGIRVTSGYRCPALNRAVGGVTNSVHQIGWAVDIVPSNGKLDEFSIFLKNWLPNYKKSWDQCIWETRGKSRWIHFGWMNANGGQRRQMFSLTA